jgi:hypothetical protein
MLKGPLRYLLGGGDDIIGKGVVWRHDVITNIYLGQPSREKWQSSIYQLHHRLQDV